MFQPPLFRETRIDVMQALMKAHPFATLVSAATGGLSADHIPLVIHPELSENGNIRGHLAAANPLWRKTERDVEVLAIFQGPHAYITPSWYASKQEHGKVVPTWNYAVVHAHGVLRFCRDHDWLMEHLAELTNRHEGNRATPWAVTDAPAEFLERQLKGLVGFEIEVETLNGNWKVSQNKNDQDRVGVELGLLDENTADAASMSDLVKRAAK
ncbi:FMN-binding negative transcriptional regulator [Aliiroseovarius sp. YM-037]|uniref:FMN-binding negative transcriptional regulator n=1 Tax=Aliiroseovarius sp. YM-037 TaxID=3341728 RepID=UPI003A8105B4